jgi:hypothetical protein
MVSVSGSNSRCEFNWRPNHEAKREHFGVWVKINGRRSESEFTAGAAELNAEVVDKTRLFLRSAAKTSASNAAKPSHKDLETARVCKDLLGSNYDPIT